MQNKMTINHNEIVLFEKLLREEIDRLDNDTDVNIEETKVVKNMLHSVLFRMTTARYVFPISIGGKSN